MALSFPDAPSLNDTYSADGTTWTWNGSSWDITNRFSQQRWGTATGGDSSATITVGSDSYTLLTFTSSGTLTVSQAGLFDVLVVGGGGGGSSAFGGGGAGGYVSETVYFAANQTVTVGAGGSGSANTSTAGGRGNASRCGGIVAGFGGGAKALTNLNSQYNASGASGAGGNLYSSTGNQGDGITGNDGGDHLRPSGTDDCGGGGGGADAAGADGTTSGGNGGAGRDASAFRGESLTTTYYAGGGGGGSDINSAGSGGVGGGGNGALTTGTATAGTANTGGGGGGSAGGVGAAGGSGIVLVRFKN